MLWILFLLAQEVHGDDFSEDPYKLLMSLASPPGYNQYILPPDRPDVVPSKDRDGNEINGSV